MDTSAGQEAATDLAMATIRPKRSRDTIVLAKLIGDIATGQIEG